MPTWNCGSRGSSVAALLNSASAAACLAFVAALWFWFGAQRTSRDAGLVSASALGQHVLASGTANHRWPVRVAVLTLVVIVLHLYSRISDVSDAADAAADAADAVGIKLSREASDLESRVDEIESR